MLATACSDASSPKSAPTLSITLPGTTVQAGDSITVTVTGGQPQNFLYSVALNEVDPGGVTHSASDSTPGGTTRLSIRVTLLVPPAPGAYMRFFATDSAYREPRVAVVDSALIQ
jgi:hypothetical protein